MIEMKTVATKLNNEDYENFIKDCNGTGCTPAEKLRQLIKNSDSKYSSKESKKFVHPEFAIYDDNGKVIYNSKTINPEKAKIKSKLIEAMNNKGAVYKSKKHVIPEVKFTWDE